jgi:hypothetical protein
MRRAKKEVLFDIVWVIFGYISFSLFDHAFACYHRLE